MTDRTITLPLRRWHKLLKAMGEVRPGLTGDWAAWCDKFRAYMEKELFNQMGLQHAITQPDDAWARLCGFCDKHAIPYAQIHQQVTGATPKPVAVEVDNEELAECKRLLAMADDEFERATKVQDDGVSQGVLFE